MTKIAGSGSTSQKHGSEDPDPDPPQNVMDPEHWYRPYNKELLVDFVTSTFCHLKEFLKLFYSKKGTGSGSHFISVFFHKKDL
jgi:hypothetical protein